MLRIWLCLAACASPQTSPVPYIAGLTFNSQLVVHSYPGSYSSIREVDFRNLRVQHTPTGGIPLRNGHYERNAPFDHFSADLDSVNYLTPPSHTGEGFALVVYSWFAVGGSSTSGDDLVVFNVSHGRLKSVQSINSETHSAGTQPTWSFDPKTNTLVIRSDHYRPGDAHCCISAVDVVTYRWNGAHFVQTGIATEPLHNKPDK